MDKEQYREALAKLRLSQAAAGDLFEVGARTSRRWALGEARIPTSVAMWLELMTKKRYRLELELPVSAERSSPERRIWTFQSKQNVHALE